ncbi:hypothetical protein F7734_58535 [Scytonema sp. UIC 10036]|uniref:ATP-binding protein n=1 Tax=Scytonema sp. UIC 10036 TaxID=2304196 RepID=UPI0012DADB24|nr:ATP-binding protein [Scytonema sp. UIC 10036]MUH01546.1 hypothetical protein [Scytonema sp. UIC 10036]
MFQITHTFNIPEFKYDGETGLISTWVQIAREPEKPLEDPVVEVKKFLQPVESLIGFVRDAYHVGLWAETGTGKSTAISNIIGGMIQELGGTPTIRTTVPKIDADTAKIFPHVDWLGVPESIFGLLEAALEIQYRIWINEQAFRAGEEIKDFSPILFFIDEINLIFTRWGNISDNDLENVLQRFKRTLQGERLAYFECNMVTELTNYKKEFAKRLLLFIWQTGRSLRVKSLIAGQNLQPGSFGFKVNDLANCSYISFGDSIRACTKYKVRDVDSADNTKQYNLIQKALSSEPNFKYIALYCPSQGKSFYGILPPPNYYKWEKNLLCPKTLDNTPDNLDNVQTNVQTRPTVDNSHSKGFGDFDQMSKLPQKFQNLPYEGYVQLWRDLPKKADGSVHKTQAYERVFGVKRSDERKVVSDFIDYLQQHFK